MDDVARKIRALLDKAEATNYPAERDTFIAKATALMVQHNIDKAMIGRSRGEGRGTAEITTHNIEGAAGPFSAARHMLLNAAASVTGAETWRGGGLFTVVGTLDQIEMTETLYTSFLLQTAAGVEKSWTKADGHRTRFARSYMIGFAMEVGRRINEQIADTVREAEKDMPGAGLVLVDMADRIQDWKREQGIRTHSTTIRGSGSASGHDAGRRDGRTADIGNERVRGVKGILV